MCVGCLCVGVCVGEWGVCVVFLVGVCDICVWCLGCLCLWCDYVCGVSVWFVFVCAGWVFCVLCVCVVCVVVCKWCGVFVELWVYVCVCARARACMHYKSNVWFFSIPCIIIIITTTTN